MTSVASIETVADALAVLRSEYSGLLADLSSGDRVVWVGSGVSRNQVPGLEQLIRKVLGFLRDNIAPGVPSDPHLGALERIITAQLPSELDGFRSDPCSWAVPDDLTPLVQSYSDILGEDVDGKPQDYLVWDAVDVRETYGSADIKPGPEHVLIAFMVHEGVIESIATTNWDGLIERAVKDSTPGGSTAPLAVMMSNESFRAERGDCTLYKAHGCAILAREDASFRRYLVAQTADIAAWPSNPIYESMVERLHSLARTRRSLMLGLSVQDYNLLMQIAKASQVQPWPWDCSNPAYLFAEPEVLPSQRDVLKVVYGDDYSTSREAICGGSVTGMYSGLLLAATALHVVVEKLKLGVDYAPAFAGSGAVVASLTLGISRIETQVAEQVGGDLDRLVDVLRLGISSLVRRFFEPTRELTDDDYVPIYSRSLRAGVDDHYKLLRLPELSVTLGLLGLGSEQGHWTLAIGTGGGLERGVLALTSTHGPTLGPVKVVITRDSVATSALKGTDIWAGDPGDLLVIQATGERPDAMARGFGGGIGSGRTGRRPRREVWLSDLTAAAGDPTLLLESFRAELSS